MRDGVKTLFYIIYNNYTIFLFAIDTRHCKRVRPSV